MEYIKQLLANETIRNILLFVGGVTVGVLFYPERRIEERVSQKYEAEIAVIKETHAKEMQSSLEEKLQLSSEFRKYHDESEQKISKLTTEIRNLQSKQKTAYYKIVRPDGTIEIKKFSESEVNESSQVITQVQEEFKRKVEQIENKWETIHQKRVTEIVKDFNSKEESYKKEISELKKERIETVNTKRFGAEAGYLSNKNYYGHATADIWGPVFLGVHGQLDPSNNAGVVGAGVGVKF